MDQAQADPASRKALVIVLSLLKKYASKLGTTATAFGDTAVPTLTPVVWAEPAFAAILSGVKVILSRMASRHSLDPLVHALYVSTQDLVNLPAELSPSSQSYRELKELLEDVSAWFDSSLCDARYLMSSESKSELGALYDRARVLVDDASVSDIGWIRHLRNIFHEVDTLTAAIRSDKSTHRFVDAFSSLSASLGSLVRSSIAAAPGKLEVAQRKIRTDLQHDLLRWFLPRLVHVFRAIPMPRVEYVSTGTQLAVAVDTMYLTPSSGQASLVPDHIRICSYSEVRLDVVEVNSLAHIEPTIPSVAADEMQPCTRMCVFVDGVRLSARDIGYYVSWRAFRSRWLRWLGYEDEGLVSLDVGGRGVYRDGLSFDFELEYYNDGGNHRDVDTLFKVMEVHVTVQGLRLSLDKSKHWILNKMLLQPLSGTIGRLAAGWVLRRQLEGLLNSLGRMAAQSQKAAQDIAECAEKDVDWTDYALAIWHVFSGEAGSSSSDEEDEEEAAATEEQPVVETHTSATAKGIVHQSVTYRAEDDARSSRSRTPAGESVLAVGIGAQILPGKGGPGDQSAEDWHGPREMVREGLDEVQSRVDEVMEAGHEALRHGTSLRRGVERADQREHVEESAERRRGGWRSRAFDV